MKLQNMAIIFIAIMLPIILVLSAYTQNQIDTITLQSSYTTKLYDATYDAVTAFQLNTLHNRYSTVSDSLRRDIKAAIQTFMTNLATNLGVGGYSETYLKPYIPAITFTLYDGYYIYAPSVTTKIDSDGNEEKTYEHVLKPYIYYTTRYYINSDTDFVVNYSLDNYMVVYGKINGEYYTKAGYLISKKEEVNQNEKLIERLPVTRVYQQTVTDSVTGNLTKKETLVTNLENVEVTSSELLKSRLEFNPSTYIDPKSDDYYIDPESAKKYYEDAYEFTTWVNENLSNIKASDAIKPDGTRYEGFGSERIFNISESNNPERPSSDYSVHKRECIKQSIQDNLNQAMASYNDNSSALGTVYSFRMPVLTEDEWEKVLTNVCMITFMQGLPVGNKVYNDYAIVTSTSNKEYVDQESLYFYNTEGGDGRYHKIGCKHLVENGSIVGYRNYAYEREYYEETIDGKTSNKYFYRHGELACYYCIVSSQGREETSWRDLPDGERKTAFYTTLAREKYNFYKTNAYFKSLVVTTLADSAKEGDYVNYSFNGYDKWRIIKNNGTKITLVSVDCPENYTYNTSTPEEALKALSNIVQKYKDSSYAQSARIMNYDDFKSASNILTTISKDYWIEGNDTALWKVLENGNVNKSDEYNTEAGVRVVVELMAGTQTIGKDSNGVWQLVE